MTLSLAGLGALATCLAILLWPGTWGRPPHEGPGEAAGTGDDARLVGRGTGLHATPPRNELPMVCDALAALLSSGMPLASALEAVGGAEGPAPGVGAVGRRLRWGSPWDEAWTSAPGCTVVQDALALANSTGAPAAALLRDAAHSARRAQARAEEAEAAAIGVRLVLPLGLCALPAFICWGIVPIALELLPWV